MKLIVLGGRLAVLVVVMLAVTGCGNVGQVRAIDQRRCDLTTELGGLMVLEARLNLQQMDPPVRGREPGACNPRQTPYDMQLMPEAALTAMPAGQLDQQLPAGT